MASYDSLLESAAEKLAGNERLRSNMTDDEFNPCLDWALARLTRAIAKAKDKEAAQKILEKDLKSVETILKTLNDALKDNKTPTLESAAKLLKIKLPKQKIKVKARQVFISEILKLVQK
jgi:hypothetical protein